LIRPFVALLEGLLKLGLAATTSGSQPTMQQVHSPEEARSLLVSVWRVFDPSVAGFTSAAEDPLRRAVNRVQRLTPDFAVLERTSRRASRSAAGSLPALSPAWVMDASVDAPVGVSGVVALRASTGSPESASREASLDRTGPSGRTTRRRASLTRAMSAQSLPQASGASLARGLPSGSLRPRKALLPPVMF